MSDHNPASVSKLIELVSATLSGAPSDVRLTLFSDFIQMDSTPEEKCIGWAMKSYCHAHLNEFERTVEAQDNARREYADHIGLPSEIAEAYLENPFDTIPRDGTTDFGRQGWIQEPHLTSLFQSGAFMYTPAQFEGDTFQERANNAMQSWRSASQPGDHFQTQLCSLLAFLYKKIGYYEYAVQVLDRMIMLDDFLETRGMPSTEMFWGGLMAGDCCAAQGTLNLAVPRWHRVRSYDQMLPEYASGYELKKYWTARAKHQLTKHGVAVPSEEQTRAAQQHLLAAWEWWLKSDAEVEGLDIADMATMIQQDGDRYRSYVSEAAREIGIADQHDPFVHIKVFESEDGPSTWVDTNEIKVDVFHKRGMAYLAYDQFDEAINEFRQGISVRSSMRSTLWLGFARDGKGEKEQACQLYDACITRPRFIASRLEDDETVNTLSEVAKMFRSQM